MPLLIALLILCCALPAHAATDDDGLLIAAGAGYKRPLLALYQAFERDSGIGVEAAFGNMRQVLAQTRASARVALVVGERRFLAESGLFARTQPFGRGRLVLVRTAELADRPLTDPAFRRIALPDPARAIYGRAALQSLAHDGLREALAERLTVLATVPQVAAHLRAGSVEAGFINATEARALDPERLVVETIDPSHYAPLEIVIGVPTRRAPGAAAERFLDFVTTPAARDLLAEYGL
ncbi:molybdate ABC transporter substrate-binding protein [Marichromatium gracile]|uniref:Molybdate transport system substrate-binding protein n=1 Tax=Marichromatium gracile TaxID=1048 RepID=A0ABR5VE50_MARGR|nr:molybdate ABC transporter substrate-binding protein [Marichromatium gracile]KXX64005.1 hypothetical protein AY586_15090 [Marichromatium gracile]